MFARDRGSPSREMIRQCETAIWYHSNGLTICHKIPLEIHHSNLTRWLTSIIAHIFQGKYYVGWDSKNQIRILMAAGVLDQSHGATRTSKNAESVECFLSG